MEKYYLAVDIGASSGRHIFLLTGRKRSEYTNATSTQLVNVLTRDWDDEIIEALGLPRHIFRALSQPGQTVGPFTPAIRQAAGFDCQVVLPATHDTASAVMAVPAQEEDVLYISSGTWSLMGVENQWPVTSELSRMENFTNEGGYGQTIRYLKNIMGLWMIQSARHEWDDAYTFAQLCDLAEEKRGFPSRVDVDDAMFLAPDSMIGAIQRFCEESRQPVPESVGQVAAVIYQSLAESYAKTADNIEALTGNRYAAIHIVGGGSNAAYLNKLTAEKSGRTVLAGPAEATAIGNLTAQMIAAGEMTDLKGARKIIFDSFPIAIY